MTMWRGLLGRPFGWDHHERGVLCPLLGETHVTSPANLRSRAGMSEFLKENSVSLDCDTMT